MWLLALSNERKIKENRKLLSEVIIEVVKRMQRNLIVFSHGRIWYAVNDFGLFTQR